MENRRATIFISALLLFVISLGFYSKTLAPTISWSHNGADGGDLITAIATLGIPHPPGYPTYVLLGRLFSTLPIGDFAYRINLMSAFFAALAVVFTFLTTLYVQALMEHRDIGSDITSLLAPGIGALSLAFAPVFWSQAIIAEVYAPSAFFVSLALFLLASWAKVYEQNQKGQTWWLAGAGLTMGVGTGAHLSLVLLVPPALFLVWRERNTPWKAVILASFFSLLGSLVYLYLPWRAGQYPPVNWGNPSSKEQFLWMITGAAYKGYAFGLPPQFLLGRVGAWARILLEQFNALGIFIAALGWLALWDNHKRTFFFFLSFSLLISIFAIGYNTTDSFVYLIPALIMLSICIGIGLHSLLSNQVAQWVSRITSSRQWRLSSAVIFGLIFILLPGFSMFRNYPQMDSSGDRLAYSYGESAMKTAKPGSVILADADNQIFTLWYFRYVVHPESDVQIIGKTLLQYNWYQKQLQHGMPELVPERFPEEYSVAVLGVVSHNLGKREIYLTSKDEVLLGSFIQREEGPLFRLEAKQ